MWLNSQAAAPKPCRYPAPTCIPVLEAAEVAARYQAARVGGDFFDFLTPGARLVFLLVDIAGRREQALDLAASMQDTFRARVPELFDSDSTNEADAIITLTVELNRALLEAAGGVRCAPAFLGCYSEPLGALTYVNAGHMPGLLRDSSGISQLDAVGLPLGLFSHATHDAQLRILEPGAALLLASKGLLETRRGKEEFGLERLKECFQAAVTATADELCDRVLGDVKLFATERRRINFFRLGNHNNHEFEFQNDATTLALIRRS